ncbi:Plasma membrane fusion protein PRM1 [Clarias magur]|uniref:Plasma membrane fusion protein PRM1 n=1 Tax=Clarias magur TaxID=1594786 RepID=A0A8J4UTP8_CLAMG|nr:Plasma membrane fusion protein PRM1 [Clarias magur]
MRATATTGPEGRQSWSKVKAIRILHLSSTAPVMCLGMKFGDGKVREGQSRHSGHDYLRGGHSPQEREVSTTWSWVDWWL